RIALGGSGFGATTLDKRLALGIGTAIGDGSANAGSNPAVTFTMHSDEWPVLNDVAKAINYEKAGYVDDGRSHRPTTVTAPARETLSPISTGNARIAELFSRYAVLDRGSAEKRFTDAVYQLDRGTVAAILRGLFTADGTVADYGSKSQYVSLDSCSLTLLKQTQHLLLSFGIKSKIYTNRRSSLVSN